MMIRKTWLQGEAMPLKNVPTKMGGLPFTNLKESEPPAGSTSVIAKMATGASGILTAS
jgi:hypothetical protein